MHRTLELEKAEKELKEIGAKIEQIKFHINGLEANMAVLTSVKTQYRQNMKVLKSSGIITAINEYKKIREEFQAVINRLNVLRVDFNNHQAALNKTEKMLFEANSKYATLLKNLDAKILRGRFGKK